MRHVLHLQKNQYCHLVGVKTWTCGVLPSGSLAVVTGAITCFFSVYSSSSLSPDRGGNLIVSLLEVLLHVLLDRRGCFARVEPNVALCKLLSHCERMGSCFRATLCLGSVTVSARLQHADELKPLNMLTFWYLWRILEKHTFFSFKPLRKNMLKVF